MHSSYLIYLLYFLLFAHSLARAKTQLFSFQWFPHSLPQNTRGGGRVAMLNSPSRAKWPPSLRGNSSFVFFTTDNCSRTTVRFPVLLVDCNS